MHLILLSTPILGTLRDLIVPWNHTRLCTSTLLTIKCRQIPLPIISVPHLLLQAPMSPMLNRYVPSAKRLIMPIVKLYTRRTDAKLYRLNINKVEAGADMDVDVGAMRRRMAVLVDAIRNVAGRVVMVVVEDSTTIGSLRSNFIVSTKLDISNSYVIMSHEVRSKLTLSKPHPYLL